MAGGVRVAFAWIVARYKSMPSIVVRALVATLLGFGDFASDIFTIVSLFGLGHLGSAYALLVMVLLSLLSQVRPQWAAARSARLGRAHALALRSFSRGS
jgi:hypothetical protein